MTLPVTLADVEAAAARLDDDIVHTPTTTSRTLSALTGAEIVLKFENLQFTASFKERGARNRLLLIPEPDRARGVVAASAGNHAQGVAHHARLLGIPATIVMPETTPFGKVAATEVLGAQVVLVGAGFAEAAEAARRICTERGATLISAFDDPAVIAGQGTLVLEVLDAAPDVEVIVVPVGGGGLISGIAVAAKARRPDVEIVGVEAEGYTGMLAALGRGPAPSGGPTIADGIAVKQPGHLTREIVAALVDDLVVVREQTIEEAVALLLEIEKVVAEGAAAVPLAAVLEHPARFRGRRVALIVSGGNIDLRLLSSVILRALARSGRLIRLCVEVADLPGALAQLATAIGAAGGNIVDVTHRRDLPGVAVRATVIEISVETRDRAHADEIVAAVRALGHTVDVV